MEEGRVLFGPDAAIDISKFQKNVSVIEILFQAIKNNGESIFQIEADTGKTITSTEFLKQSTTIAANLKKLGITEGDTVVVCLDKSILAYSILAAVVFTGATVALWATFFSKDDIQLQLKISQPKIVFCSKVIHEKTFLSEAANEPITFFPDGSSPHLEINIFSEENDQDFTFYQVKDIKKHFPLILFTSGTTGPSKPVLIPNNALQRYGYSFSDEETRRFLVMAPFCWISSVVTFISSVLKNYTMVLSCPDPVLHLQYTQLYKTDTWMITPTKMLALLDVPNLSNYDLTSLKKVITGGGTLSLHLKKTFMEKLFTHDISVEHLYGLTESGVFTSFSEIDPETTKNTSSSGKLASGAQLKVIDENGQTVGPGIQGELKVKTDTMMANYVGYPEATSRAFDSEGWFCTGDVGYYDENGFIYAIGRLSDRIHYKDQKLCMTPVEELLVTHPAVHDTVIVAKPHSVDNQHPAAFVVLRLNVKATGEDIQKYIDEQVADDYKLRGGVHFIDSIPKLPNGKILRYVLQTRLQD